jgi:ATP-dependent Lon protease
VNWARATNWLKKLPSFREKIETAKMPKIAEEEALRQLKKLERMHPDAAETATYVTGWRS